MSRLDPRLLLQCYAAGIFPMADSRDAAELFWVEPRTRAIIPLAGSPGGFHMSRSLRRTLRSGRFHVTHDQDFAAVITTCANRDETWINDKIESAMLALHATGHAHSIEIWSAPDEGSGEARELVGGLYGVRLGRAFFGESMFSTRSDASKVALAWLVARLKVGGFTLLDCQFMTDHLASLGAVSVPRSGYIALLATALGGGSAGAGAGTASAGDGSVATSAAGSLEVPPDFGALDRLLDATGVAGAPGPAGYVIAQLLGQTS